MTTRILLVDANERARAETYACLQGCKLEVHQADTGDKALQLLAKHPGPWIVLLDWAPPAATVTELCKAIRKTLPTLPPYIILTSPAASRADIALGIRSGADEFIQKPIAPDILRERIRAARRLVTPSHSPSAQVLQGLADGVMHGSGELIVRDGSRVFRVLFYRHRVAFVSGSAQDSTLRDVLCAHGLPKDDITAAMGEARSTGQGFFDVLLEWKLINVEQLRALTRSWIERRLASMIRSEHPQVLFVPRQYPKGSDTFCFDLEEVLPPDCMTLDSGDGYATSMVPPSTPLQAWQHAFLHVDSPTHSAAERLDELMAIDGAISAALLDCFSSRCEGWSGEPPDPQVTWSVLQALNALSASGKGPEEMVLATESTYQLARFADDERKLICYLVVQRSAASLGMARASLASVCAMPLELVEQTEFITKQASGQHQ